MIASNPATLSRKTAPRLRVFLSALLALAVLVPASLRAATSGNFYYTDNGTSVTITGLSNPSFSGTLDIPASINGKPVTAIANGAFYGCGALTAVIIPNSITTIGNLVFASCSALTSVTIPDSVTGIGDSAFISCKALTGVTIPDSVTTIGAYAFGESGLTGVTIPNSVATIGSGAFQGCGALTNIIIPTSVTTIGNLAFLNCSKLGSITVDVTNPSYSSIDGVLFNKQQTILLCYPEGRTGAYTIPDSVTTIDDSAFSGCGELTGITIPDSVTTIGNSAFSWCGKLTDITIPDSVTTIGFGMFYCCSALTDVTISNSITTIGFGMFTGCSSLKNIAIPASVTTIDDSAFSRCSSLTGITIPGSVTTIGNDAFFACDGLINITIPNGVQTIGDSAFSWCGALTEVTIPGSVTFIDNFAFRWCNQLASAEFLGDAPYMGNGVFEGASNSGFVVKFHDTMNGFTSPVWQGYMTLNLEVPGLWYTETATEVTIMGITQPLVGAVTIPETIRGKPVTAISNNAFSGCIGMTSVTIPNSVTSIGAYAFYGCTGLSKVTIPYHVAFIGNYAFANCTNLFEAEFLGNAPSMETGVFDGTGTWFSVKYYTGAAGFTAPTWMGYASTEATFPFNYVDTGDGILITGFVNGQPPFYTPPFRDIPPYIAGKPVTGIGDGAFANCYWLENVMIPASVTFIGNSAFAYSKMAKVTIPASVTSIGSNAFSQCGYLTSAEFLGNTPDMGYGVFDGAASGFTVQFHDTSTGFTTPSWMGYHSTNIDVPFYYTETATEVTITGVIQPSASTLIVPATIHGKPVTTIASMAFVNGAGLTSITIPASVTTLGDNWISGNNLVSISVDDSNPVYSSADGVLFDKGKTTLLLCPVGKIGDYTIPDGVSSIGKSAFQNCYYLTGVTIPPSVASIGDTTFLWCSSLTSLTLPSGVVSIGSGAFEYCTGLTVLAIPDSVASFAPDACYGCTGLAALSVDTANPNYSSENGILFDKDKTALLLCPEGKTGACAVPSSVTSIAGFAFGECTGLTSVVIPSGVTSIGNYTFRSCTGLTSVTFPSGLVSIGEGAFMFCGGLTNLSLPPSVSGIGDWAFYACSGLTSIKIPSGVKSLGFDAFYWCNQLASAEFLGNAPAMGSQVFGRNAAGFTVKYHSSKSGFATPTWNGYPTERIVDASVATTSLPLGTTGAAYQQTLAATGGTAPYTWSLVSGSLPPGLVLGSDGILGGTPASAGATNFVVQVSGSDGFATTAPLTLTISQPLTTWQESRFTPEEIASGRTSPTADFDGDGVPNLLEYAFGGDPKNSDAAAIAPAPDTSGNNFQISFSCDSTCSDITYTVQASSSLAPGSWTDIAQSVGGAPALPIDSLSTVSDPGTGQRTVTVTDSSPLTGSRFLRIQVSPR